MRNICYIPCTSLACLLLAACADFKAIKAFSKDGSQVAAIVKSDLEVLTKSCNQLKEQLKITAIAESRPPNTTSCDQVVQAHKSALASTSLDLLVRYNEALTSLANDTNWTEESELSDLSTSIQNVETDKNSGIENSSQLARYKSAATSISNAIISAVRERKARELLSADLNWNEALMPLRFYYGGPDGVTPSFYSEGCKSIRTDWNLAAQEVEQYAECNGTRRNCEQLAAAVLLIDVDNKSRDVVMCSPLTGNTMPSTASSRVKLIDDWIAANDALKKEAFKKDPKHLIERLETLAKQISSVRALSK